MLAVRSFESPHTGERILHIVKAVLQEWDIPCHQVGKILTDNGSNMLKAFHDTIEDSNDDDSLDPSENSSVAVVVEEDENLTNSTSADDMDQDDIELSHFEDNDLALRMMYLTLIIRNSNMMMLFLEKTISVSPAFHTH